MLYLVATPIGEFSEITLRALEVLKHCEVIICESTKETSKLLKHHALSGKKYEILNEHSTPEDLRSLVQICGQQDVALVSDCGTPGFCDPGPDLIALCRAQKISVRSVLGASSLMGLLSLSSVRLKEFVFRGFLPAENEERKKEIQKLKAEKRAIVLMDTPYRLKKLLSEMAEALPQRSALLVTNLSQDDEAFFEASLKNLPSQVTTEKAEFMLLVYPG